MRRLSASPADCSPRNLPFTDAFTVMAAGVAGWHPTPQEEVSMNPSCPTQGLLIAENAG